MSNSNLPAVNPTALSTGLQKASARGLSQTGDIPYLKLDKSSGEWIYGADDTPIQEKSVWAVNPFSFAEGWIAWGDREVLGEEMTPMVGGDVILKADLPQIDGAEKGWQRQLAVQLRCTNGEDVGTQVLYKVNSIGGMKSLRKLLDEVATQAGNVSSTDVVALVELGNDSYKHKKYGKIWTPTFTIGGWATMDGEKAAVKSDDSAEEAQAEASIPAEAAAPKPERKRRRAVAT